MSRLSLNNSFRLWFSFRFRFRVHVRPYVSGSSGLSFCRVLWLRRRSRFRITALATA